jgi:hypothetical protein
MRPSLAFPSSRPTSRTTCSSSPTQLIFSPGRSSVPAIYLLNTTRRSSRLLQYRSVPLIGNYLNIMAQAQSCYAVLENCVDFMAADLEKGFESEWIGKRLGVKEKSKAK